MCLSIQPRTGPRDLIENTGAASDAATTIFKLPDYRVISAGTNTNGRRHIVIETDFPPGCPCDVLSSRRKDRRIQRVKDIPVAGAVEVFRSKYRWYCEEPACEQLSYYESTSQVPYRAHATGRLREQVVHVVIRSGRAVAETAPALGVSWSTVRAALTEKVAPLLSDLGKLRPRMLGIR